MKVLRYVVGKILLFLNFLTQPSLGQRSVDKQKEVEEELKTYSLYQFSVCPFCIKVRRVMRRLNLPIELKNANTDEDLKAELLLKGGSPKVPCLKIGDQWMYESKAIINYLEDKFPVS
jgi:glutaredoxin